MCICLCLCHPFYTHTHTHTLTQAPHKAAIILTSGGGDSCADLTQKMHYLRNTEEEARWERLGGIRGRLSRSPRAPSEIQEAAGTSCRAQRLWGRSAHEPPPISTEDQLNSQPPAPTTTTATAPPLVRPWRVKGRRILPTRRAALAPMASGQSSPRSQWDAGSHGNLWTQAERRKVRDESWVSDATASCARWLTASQGLSEHATLSQKHANTHTHTHRHESRWRTLAVQTRTNTHCLTDDLTLCVTELLRPPLLGVIVSRMTCYDGEGALRQVLTHSQTHKHTHTHTLSGAQLHPVCVCVFFVFTAVFALPPAGWKEKGNRGDWMSIFV